MKQNKMSQPAKEENEFQKLARLSMNSKDQKFYEKQFKKNAKTESTRDLIKAMGYLRHEFLMKGVDLQEIVMEYNTIKQYNTENWAKNKLKEYKDQIKKYHEKIKGIYREQNLQSMQILANHKELEKRLGFEFELSANNPYKTLDVAVSVVDFLKKEGEPNA
jgi:hypothetical protein